MERAVKVVEHNCKNALKEADEVTRRAANVAEQEEKCEEKEAKEVAQLAACKDIIIEATLILENFKNYKEVHGMFPGRMIGS